jgi:hypothetical protein
MPAGHPVASHRSQGLTRPADALHQRGDRTGRVRIGMRYTRRQDVRSLRRGVLQTCVSGMTDCSQPKWMLGLRDEAQQYEGTGPENTGRRGFHPTASHNLTLVHIKQPHPKKKKKKEFKQGAVHQLGKVTRKGSTRE